MSKRFLTPVDLGRNELRNARVQNLATAPANPVAGQLYFNTNLAVLLFFDGGEWVEAKSLPAFEPTFGPVRQVLFFQQPSDSGSESTFARSDHSHGTPPHGVEEHQAFPLSTFSAATDGIDLGGFEIYSVGDPTTPASATPRSWVEAAIANLVDTAPGTLDTLRELAAALGDDPNFATTVTNQIATIDGRVDTETTRLDGEVARLDGDVVRLDGEVVRLDGRIDQQVGTATTNFEGEVVRLDGRIDGTVARLTPLEAESLSVRADLEASHASLGTRIDGHDSRITVLEGAKYAETIGDGTATNFAVTHGLNTRDVTVSIWETSGAYELVEATVELTSTNVATIRFGVAPATGAYRVVIRG